MMSRRQASSTSTRPAVAHHPGDEGIWVRGGRPVSVRGQQMEQDILAAAARMFNEKGYAATSIRDIADAVGLLKGSLYYYVRSKEDLLYKIIVSVQDGASRTVNRAAGTEGSAVDRVRALVREHFERCDPGFIMMRVFAVDFKHLSADRRATVLEERDRYERQVSELIAAGQDEGRFATDLDPGLAAVALISMLHAFSWWYQPDGDLEMSEIARQYERLIIGGLLKATDRERDVDAAREDLSIARTATRAAASSPRARRSSTGSPPKPARPGRASSELPPGSRPVRH